MPKHESVTSDRICDLYMRDDCTGICFACGEEQDGVEPDADGYHCDSCGEMQVYGVELALLYATPIPEPIGA